MPESTNITLPKSMTLPERISEANKQITNLIKSLEKPFNDDKDYIQLLKYKKVNEGYTYHYIIARDVNSATRKR